MSNSDKRIVFTGFMGVGKSSVARHLSYLLRCERKDLDYYIEENQGGTIAEIFKRVGEEEFRRLESMYLKKLLDDENIRVISLGGGAWMPAENRDLIKRSGCVCVWLESSFEHCWHNIRHSKRERPLAKNKKEARNLFKERQKVYCLADWHFVVKPEFTSYEVAKNIAEQIFQWKRVNKSYRQKTVN